MIDGHHKAMAAALEHRNLNALVISPCYEGWMMIDGKKRCFLGANDAKFCYDEIGISGQEENELNCPQSLKSNDTFEDITTVKDEFAFEIDTKMLASYYPTVAECASIDNFETITDELMDDFLCRNKVYDVCEYGY